ncbi:hypothetical protein yaldo0001_30340 [Yersinia aldovae ATCC 35236]|nr:hypothetical protein yaldo0001_30340 [Yersinia aldovae ATCC 35236]
MLQQSVKCGRKSNVITRRGSQLAPVNLADLIESYDTAVAIHDETY